jgi:hypothetical protein
MLKSFPEPGCVGLTKIKRQGKSKKVYFPQKNVGMICKKCNLIFRKIGKARFNITSYLYKIL